jgi:TRAP-type C4-dicarboxylate transport system permease small subunit
MAIYTVVHIINTCINTYIPGADVNYMFSIEATNPLTELFYKLIPCQYWYMYLVLPIAAVYLLGVYTPQIRANLRQRKAVKKVAEKTA